MTTLPAVDVVALVAASGGQIAPDPVPDARLVGASASLRPELRVFFDGGSTIYLPSNTTARKDRFTIAHCLGHVTLHATPSRDSVWLRYARGRHETEADRYAFELLMPEEDYVSAYARTDGDIAMIADMFEVSRTAATTRSKMLGLVATAS